MRRLHAPLARPDGTARATGLLCLGMALAGGIGFLLLRPQIFDAGDPAAILGHLVADEQLARSHSR